MTGTATAPAYLCRHAEVHPDPGLARPQRTASFRRARACRVDIAGRSGPGAATRPASPTA